MTNYIRGVLFAAQSGEMCPSGGENPYLLYACMHACVHMRVRPRANYLKKKEKEGKEKREKKEGKKELSFFFRRD